MTPTDELRALLSAFGRNTGDVVRDVDRDKASAYVFIRDHGPSLLSRLAEVERDAEDRERAAIVHALTKLSYQFDELSGLAYEEDERTRRDVWASAAEQARARCKHSDWIDAARGKEGL